MGLGNCGIRGLDGLRDECKVGNAYKIKVNISSLSSFVFCDRTSLKSSALKVSYNCTMYSIFLKSKKDVIVLSLDGR